MGGGRYGSSISRDGGKVGESDWLMLSERTMCRSTDLSLVRVEEGIACLDSLKASLPLLASLVSRFVYIDHE